MVRSLTVFVGCNNLKLHVHQPARITDISASILDQFITTTNVNMNNVCVMPPLATSDHCQTTSNISLCIQKQTCITRLVWFDSRADWNGLNEAIIDYDWIICFTTDDINQISSRFTESFLNLARQFIPNKVVTIRPHDKPWCNNVLRALRRRRDRLFHKARSNNTFDSWQNYRECCNFYVSELKSAKEEYETRQSSKLDSPSISGHSWWQTIKILLLLDKNTSIPSLLLDNVEAVHENHTKPNIFNEYFSSQCQLDDPDLPLPLYSHLSDNSLHNLVVSERDIIDALKTLKVSKASGPDGISPRMLKHTALSISPVLAKLFNLSL